MVRHVTNAPAQTYRWCRRGDTDGLRLAHRNLASWLLARRRFSAVLTGEQSGGYLVGTRSPFGPFGHV